jgi:hypothetical protein
MTPDDYRYYRLDGLGHIQGAEWLDAASDEEAIAQLKSKHSDGTCELWKGKRLVGRIRRDASGEITPPPLQE